MPARSITPMTEAEPGRNKRPALLVDLFDIAFADPANGFAVGENGSILRSGSTGSAWTADAPEGKRHRLEKIAFAGKTVFIVGFGGTVLTTEIATENGEHRTRY